MNTYGKMYILIFVIWAICIILSYFINWTISNNGFTAMATWFMFVLLGLVWGRELTLMES